VPAEPSGFYPFSALHASGFLAIACMSVLLAWHGCNRQHRSPYVRFLGALAVIEWILFHTWKATPPELRAIETLPLQMCHWTSLAAGVYFATGWTWIRPVLYFWGLGLCTQAFLTPTLREGPGDPIFWHFWLSHGLIVVAAVYALTVDRYRPTWREYRLVCAATFCYGLAVLPINLLIGANYGFLGQSKPDQPTILDLLGAWPSRLVAIVAIVAGVMAALMLPWRFMPRAKP
jgi:hypothetical integral membrane protein (TIGR02206 family)